ncbi:MAG: GxGYxYP domain-containing protein [Opitutales bacterium]
MLLLASRRRIYAHVWRGLRHLWMVFCVLPGGAFAESFGPEIWEGEWVAVPQQSSAVDVFGSVSLRFEEVTEDRFILTERWGTRRFQEDRFALRVGGAVNEVLIDHKVFPTNVFMGVRREVGAHRRIVARWRDDHAALELEETCPILSSQGRENLRMHSSLELDPTGQVLTWTLQRSTRPADEPIVYVLKRKGYREAYYMEMTDDWAIDGDLPEQAALITLQGVVNGHGPRLYFLYGPEWDFRFTRDIFDFYKAKKQFTFSRLRSFRHALETFREDVDHYIVWDTEVRTSLIVAFTLAGLEDAIVIPEALIPVVEELGLEQIEDYRGRFTGMNDAEIYQWAYDAYWERCSKDYIVWMGGDAGRRMRPGVADFGMYHGCFFTDLSTDAEDPADAAEYALADRLFGEMNPMGMCFGWHSYAKDKERDHVKLASSHVIRVSGLHTLPNMSFNTQVPVSPGFEFRNQHNVQPGKSYKPERKVYLTAVQTDALGIGAWTRPGRGSIPYAWQVTPNWTWMGPSMLEMFYAQATPNDLFIGGLSGPGYMYPKAIPPEHLPTVLAKSREFMEVLDLSVFEIMDYSEGASIEGNPDLPRSIVETYFEQMPEAIGFINGYAPAYTFVHQDGRALVSYDYYLSPERSEAEVLADLRELAAINEARPYFLLMHVRQWSDITRVKSILDQLGPAFEVVPLDVFMALAAAEPTFAEYTRPEAPLRP